MCSFPTRNRKFQKNSKKIQKIRKNHHSFFQAKKGWERPRKREKKKSFRCIPTRTGIENSKKNRKKIQNFGKHHHSFFSSQNRLGKTEKGRKKKNHSDGFLPDPEQKIRKKQKKKFKKLENTIIASFQAKIGWETLRQIGRAHV